MINPYLRLHHNPAVDFFVKLMISLILMGSLGPLKLETEGIVPFTLQTFAILLPSILFGWRVGLIGTLAYIIAGGMGAPVFAGRESGWEHLFGVTGGFFFGFVFASLITGFFAEFPKARHPLLCFLIWCAGHFIILVLGAFWLMRFNPEGWWNIIVSLLPGAAIKSAFGLLFTQIILRLVMKREEYYRVK